MASVFDYTFNQLTRIGDDSCDKSQRNVQNTNASTYMLNQFRPECPMKSSMDFALSQPNVNYTGSHQIGIGGCNIDESSDLLLAPLTRPRCKLSLLERPFLTVPYLGRGQSNPVLESQIQQGDLANNRKSITNLTEVSHIKYSNVPMIPSLQATINNPANLVEGAAAEGWIRGGLPSRDLVKDNDPANSKANYM
jgi:hypothetical protein